jgi:hypothetical protein
MPNRVFFPQAALDQWNVDGAVDLRGQELTILGEGRRYKLAEGVLVVREVTGGVDTSELTGKVKSLAFLQELGAEVVETSMILGDNAFDVIPGWLAAPVGTFEEHLASEARKAARGARAGAGDDPKSDEELLVRFASLSS